MARRVHRREFLRQSVAAGLSLPLVAPAIGRAAAPGEALRVGCIGTGGMGRADLTRVSKSPKVRIVALCDIDERNLGSAASEFPDARKYTDWRKLLEDKDVDAVTVSTPDHTHAPATMTALRLKKHVYCQKPLTHSVHEARQIRLAAGEAGTVTQMGIQVHSSAEYRQLVEVIRSGAIGKVREAHAWSDRPLWPQGAGVGRPDRKDAVPEHIHWDTWLGVAPERPFVESVYHQSNWRGWLDFGTGAQGDMGCHIMDPVVWSLKLGAPASILSDGPAPNDETYSSWSTIHYVFPGTELTRGETIEVTWYDGGKKPPRELAPLVEGQELPGNGSLFIGEKGALLSTHGGASLLLPEKDFKDHELPKVDARDHWIQWVDACLGAGEVSAPFDYSGPLTETVLLGNLAMRFPGKKLRWRSEALRFDDAPEADRFLRRAYRKGWEIEGLS